MYIQALWHTPIQETIPNICKATSWICISSVEQHLCKRFCKVKSVQHKATKMVEEVKGNNYYERLSILGITDLESRRKRGDLIQIYSQWTRRCGYSIGLKRGNSGNRSQSEKSVRKAWWETDSWPTELPPPGIYYRPR